MARVSSARTNPSLLGRLGHSPADQQAWGEFVESYGRKIYGWCRHWGLQEADAEDVTQDVLTRLADKMQTFHYDRAGSFRGWLKTITHHAWHDFLAVRRRATTGSGDDRVLEQLEAIEAREDLLARLGDEFDSELLQEAQARVCLQVAPRTWEAFRLTALEGWSGASAAAHLGMSVASVFVARSKVQRLLRAEIQKLESSVTRQ